MKNIAEVIPLHIYVVRFIYVQMSHHVQEVYKLCIDSFYMFDDELE